MLRDHYIYDVRTITNQKKRLGMPATLPRERHQSLKDLLEKNHIDYDNHLADMLIIADFFGLIDGEWTKYHKSSLTISRQRIRDHKNFYATCQALEKGGDIGSIAIKVKGKKTITFTSDIFQIHLSNWLMSLKSNLPKNLEKEISSLKIGTKGKSRNTYLLGHAHLRAFNSYLISDHQHLKTRPKFIAKFLSIILSKAPTAKQVSESLNAKK